MSMATHLKYLASFYFPCCLVIFLYTGPHDAVNALAWTMALWLLILADFLSPKIQPKISKQVISAYYYDAILYALTAIQFLIISLLLVYACQLQWNSVDDWINSIINLLVLRILVGTTSGSSAIIVAHELIHRPQLHMRVLGRLLLYTVCYDHFVISHLRSHHWTVATFKDMTTARFDESFRCYWKRVLPGHFKYALHSEMERLEQLYPTNFLYRLLSNTVIQGLFVELSVLIFIWINFGWVATFIFLVQALSAVRLLETINYYQHWGLAQGKDSRALAWVNQSSVTEYALLGLSNHIAHHQNSATSFQETPYIEQGPVMPYGYFVTNLWVKLNNDSYRKSAKGLVENFFQQ